MGHYLSDFETNDEYENRVKYQPMRARLEVYDAEVKCGIVHTREFDLEMRDARDALRERGWQV